MTQLSQETIEKLQLMDHTIEGISKRQRQQDQIIDHNYKTLVKICIDQAILIDNLKKEMRLIGKQGTLFKTASQVKEEEASTSPGASVDERGGLSPTEWLKKKDSLLRELSSDQEKKGG